MAASSGRCSWHDADGMLLVRMIVDQIGLDILKQSPNMVLEGGETAIVVTITPLKTWTEDDDASDGLSAERDRAGG